MASIAACVRPVGRPRRARRTRFPRRGNAAPAEPGARLGPADVRTFPNAPTYNMSALRTFFFDFENADWEAELADFYNTDVEVPATLTVDGKVFKDVGVRFRGNSSYFIVPAGRKRSLNVSLDFVHENQQLGGYRTFNLLNAARGPVVPALGPVQPHRARVPAGAEGELRPSGDQRRELGRLSERAAVQQGLRPRFLRDAGRRAMESRPRRAAADSSTRAMTRRSTSAPTRSSRRTIRRRGPRWSTLRRVLNTTPPDRLEAALAPILDVDETLRFLAVDVALVNGDGYWTRGATSVSSGIRRAGSTSQRTTRTKRSAAAVDLDRERSILSAADEADEVDAALAGLVAPTWIRSSASTMRPSRCGRSCSQCRHCANDIWVTCATSRRSGSTGSGSGRSPRALTRSSPPMSRRTRRNWIPTRRSRRACRRSGPSPSGDGRFC